MRNTGFGAAIVAMGLAFGAPAACGGDSDSDGGGGKTAVDAGTDSSTGGSSGSGGSSGAGGSSGGGTGGGGACVAANCPGLSQFAPGCCKPDDSCGYDGTALGLGCVTLDEVLDGGIDANVPADAGDPNCPSITVSGFTAVGCCLPSSVCGYFVPFLNQCVDPAQLPPSVPVPDTGPPKPCGAGVDGGAADAASD